MPDGVQQVGGLCVFASGRRRAPADVETTVREKKRPLASKKWKRAQSARKGSYYESERAWLSLFSTDACGARSCAMAVVSMCMRLSAVMVVCRFRFAKSNDLRPTPTGICRFGNATKVSWRVE